MWMDGAEGAFQRLLESSPEIERWFRQEARRRGEGAATDGVRRLFAFCQETGTAPAALLRLEPRPLRLLIGSWASEKVQGGRDARSVEAMATLVRRYLQANGVRVETEVEAPRGARAARRR